MASQMFPTHRSIIRKGRRGAAVAEFALTVPLFVVLLMGICEMGRAVNATSQLTASIREAGRLACTDFGDLIPTGLTANEKIENDIRNFLTASGFPGDDVAVSITHATGDQAGENFDLNESNNYLQLFRIDASIPYSSVSSVPLIIMRDRTLRATIVFRRGRIPNAE